MSILRASNHTWQKLFNSNSINNNYNKNSNNRIHENEVDYADSRVSYNWDKCIILRENEVDIDTRTEFAKFEFEVRKQKSNYECNNNKNDLLFLQPDWMKTKEYWDREFENRYEKLMSDTKRPPLKVSIPISVNKQNQFNSITFMTLICMLTIQLITGCDCAAFTQ